MTLMPPSTRPEQELPTPGSDAAASNPQKQRKGWDRMVHAAGFSLAGLRQGWQETAFRQEVLAALPLIPLGLWLGTHWVERVLLVGSVMLVLIVELLNTAVESAIDRIGPQWHELSKRAKDMGSAAVLLALLLALPTWVSALWARLA